jgi:hypothetical protein
MTKAKINYGVPGRNQFGEPYKVAKEAGVGAVKNYQRIASSLQAFVNCCKSGNEEWKQKHHDTIKDIVRNKFPSGSGWDCGTQFDYAESNPERLVFTGSFHHMDEGGGYDGWTEHRIIVTPSLASGINIKITGRDRNQIKDYLHDIFHNALTEESVP